jgi:hypothetical protein
VSKFTPGPWAAFNNGLFVAITAGDRQVARVSSTTQDADARLIAAAPEGLQAAEQAYLFILKHVPAVSIARIQNQHVLVSLCSYIAQATGREQQDVQEDFETRAYEGKS